MDWDWSKIFAPFSQWISAKLKPIASASPAFSRFFFFSFFFFTLSSHLLPLIFSFALICYCDYFGQFGLMILDQKTLLLSVWFDLPFSTKYTCTWKLVLVYVLDVCEVLIKETHSVYGVRDIKMKKDKEEKWWIIFRPLNMSQFLIRLLQVTLHSNVLLFQSDKRSIHPLWNHLTYILSLNMAEK